jgi:hypothetical protein
MNPQYAWYFEALEAGGGRQLSRDQQQTLGITSEPQPGFYRKRNKNGADLPIAIWRDERGMIAVAGNDPVDAADVWTWCCQWPVSEQVWRDVAENGQPWPDDAPVAEAGIGHNQPSDPFDALTVEFEGEKELAEKFLSRTIETQEQADKAAVWAKRIAAIAKKATDLHKVEKQPHLDASRAVDDKWRPLKEEPDALSKRLKRHLDVFLTEQQRIERERQDAARREEERLRREAEDMARKAAESDQQSEVARNAAKEEAERLRREADAKAKEAEARNATAGRTGAKVALRTFVSARVTDYEAAALALLKMNHADLKSTIDQLANRAIRAGVDLAGVERVEEQRAA